MSRFAYFFRETLISLRRNLLMTLAGIMTVAISLFLFGGIMLLSRLVDHGTTKWRHGVELEIFMNVNATQQQISDMRDALHAEPHIRPGGIRFLNHEDAYKEFKRIFRDNPDLVKNIGPDDLPTSFRIAPTDAKYTELIADEFRNRPSVDTVVTAEQQVKNMLTATRVVRYVFFAMALVLLASSLFLIVNTIRLATFARRREIQVMKLVGATNWFIRVPFMCEGLIQGAIGAGLAFAGVYALRVILSNLVDRSKNLFSAFYVTGADAVAIGLLIVAVGATVGAMGSAIGLRRFLDA
jgi:cell division transport system permease protein